MIIDYEDIKKVTGGAANDKGGSQCPFCGQICVTLERGNRRDFNKCPACGELTYYWDPGIWVRGWMYD